MSGKASAQWWAVTNCPVRPAPHRIHRRPGIRRAVCKYHVSRENSSAVAPPRRSRARQRVPAGTQARCLDPVRQSSPRAPAHSNSRSPRRFARQERDTTVAPVLSPPRQRNRQRRRAARRFRRLPAIRSWRRDRKDSARLSGDGWTGPSRGHSLTKWTALSMASLPPEQRLTRSKPGPANAANRFAYVRLARFRATSV